jgi:hypothetical protein
MQEQSPRSDRRLALSTMLELREDTKHVWNPRELGAILKHQLAAPLTIALGSGLSAEVAHELGKLGSRQEEVKNLAMLLHHPQPPFELLNLTKRFGKSCWNDPDNPLSREIAIMLYYLSIAVADLRFGRQLSTLGRDELVKGLQWCVQQEWVDEETLGLLNETLKHLGSGRGAGAHLKTTIPPVAD